jgi:RNA polymerase sigma-54 factor
MAVAPRLELRQGQSLVMTPQLQQAIKLLQLSNLDLATYVEQELERNPLLERDEGVTDQIPGEREGEPEGPREAEPTLLAADKRLADDSPLEMAGEAPLDTSFENVYGDDEGPRTMAADGGGELGSLASVSARGSGDEDGGFEQSLAAEASLKDHLVAQLHQAAPTQADAVVALALIDLVDEAGYISDDLGELADRLGCPSAQVERVLALLQGFDPAGVCARSLKECLALQLRERDRLDPAMQAFIDHLELVARRDVAGLMRACGVDAEDVADMIREIRTLDPKPGLRFSSEAVQPVVPDVLVRRGADGTWVVELNADNLPRVLVNQRYLARIDRGAQKRADRAYLSECLASANWLVKALDQRARTILKVASEIVRQQEAFLERGVQHLRPLNLRVVAEATEMHESTVSRVTANKYMATPRGIFELKYFFSSSIASAGGGEAHSAEAVRHRIKELIEGEGDEVLSDDKLVEVLRGAGIDIARRTVAKYREALRIPSSLERRRLKAVRQPAVA